jgi:hypothetical protein
VARWIVGGLAVIYLCGVWLDGIGSGIPRRIVPQPLLYFLQVASLFTGQATAAIEYRAQGWLCDERRWAELDTRASFLINRDDKESRFHRTLHFYGRHRATLQALDAHLIEEHQRHPSADGLPAGARIGGVRFLRLRHPIPAPGEPALRWRRRPLAEHPRNETARLYWTPRSRRAERCGGLPPLASEDE